MKKLLNAILLVLVCCVGFTACSDDDDKSGLSGWYTAPEQYVSEATPSYSVRIPAYEFKNGNTVIVYGWVATTPSDSSSPVHGHSGWYAGEARYYTYVVADNKVIIENGDIWTIQGSKLYRGGTVLSKW